MLRFQAGRPADLWLPGTTYIEPIFGSSSPVKQYPTRVANRGMRPFTGTPVLPKSKWNPALPFGHSPSCLPAPSNERVRVPELDVVAEQYRYDL